jgi:hypothetical protein
MESQSVPYPNRQATSTQPEPWFGCGFSKKKKKPSISKTDLVDVYSPIAILIMFNWIGYANGLLGENFIENEV